MSEELAIDESSHYEVSLTAGQAFIAFVLLLFSLAAAFAFGLIIGRGQSDDRLVVRREPTIVSESSSARSNRSGSRIVELGVDEQATVTDSTATGLIAAPSIVEEGLPSAPEARAEVENPAPPVAAVPAQVAVPHFAQLLSTTDSASAEALAARLIDAGFNTAYVERNIGEQGTTYRVRVKFSSELAAREAADRLKAYTKGEVWITRQ